MHKYSYFNTNDFFNLMYRLRGYQGPFKNYVILLGDGGGHQKITLDYKGAVNLVEPQHGQSIKENPDFTDENQFFEPKFKQKLSSEKMQ